jgi:hypothetical protein
VTGAVLAALLAALLATLIVEESMGLSRWGAIRLAHWTARHIYAADPEQAATQAEEWEERIKEAIPSHILALCFALWLVGGALARIATPNARATTGKTPEGRSPMTMRRHAEVIMRWAARREYPDRPERAETRAEEWVHDMEHHADADGEHPDIRLVKDERHQHEAERRQESRQPQLARLCPDPLAGGRIVQDQREERNRRSRIAEDKDDATLLDQRAPVSQEHQKEHADHEVDNEDFPGGPSPALGFPLRANYGRDHVAVQQA